MKNIFDQMLSNYSLNSLTDRKNAMKEVLQEVILCALARVGFFDNVAFYGGTALRIFHGLDRFSEDLDFSLISSDDNFSFERFFNPLKNELESFGVSFSVEEKIKSVDSHIKSAFLKGNTKQHMLIFFNNSHFTENLHSDECIKIEFEVDTNPPNNATFERKYRLLPQPYEVVLYDLPSLFAGKIHAVICRAWKNRVKGRDLYDYIFYMKKNIKVNLPHLISRLKESGFPVDNKITTIEDIKNILYDKFDSINYEQAKDDVRSFIHNIRDLDIWKADFFKQITHSLQAVED